MTKPLLIVCILLSLGAAVVGFLNRGKLVETTETLENRTRQLETTSKELTAAKSEIEDQKQQITTLSSEKDTLTADLGEARNDLAKTKDDLTAAEEKATTAQAEIDQLKADAEAKDTRIAELEQEVGSPDGGTAGGGSDVAELEARLHELEMVNQQMQDQNTGLSAQVTELRREREARQNMQMRQGLTGTILAVNQAWNFVVLSLGDRQGVVPNAEMIVQRNGQFLGKVRVTSVEPSTSIADILVRTVPRGLTVMPGDKVIFQAQRD